MNEGWCGGHKDYKLGIKKKLLKLLFFGLISLIKKIKKKYRRGSS